MASTSVDLKQFLRDLLADCPVCANFIYPPIYQCPSGHLLCSNCKTKVQDRCPSCRRVMGDIRCLIVEKMAEALEFPCRYHDKGCNGLFKYEWKRKHEEECRHRPYNCPFSSSSLCAVEGDVQMLLTHMSSVHGLGPVIYSHIISGLTFPDPQSGSSTAIGCLQTITVERPATTQLHRTYTLPSTPRLLRNGEGNAWTSKILQIFHCFEEYFILHASSIPTSNGKILLVYLMFMGESSDAERFHYRLEIGQKFSKMIYKDVPVSIREGKEKVCDVFRGLILHDTLRGSLMGKISKY